MLDLYDNKLESQFLRSDSFNDILLKDGWLSSMGGYSRLLEDIESPGI